MKFVKPSCRARQSRMPTSPSNNENQAPTPSESTLKHAPLTASSTPQNQPIEEQRKEQSTYLSEIILYLSQTQPQSPPSPSYFQNQPDISQHMRSILLNWLVDVHLKYRLQPLTLFLAVHIIDAYLEKVEVKRNRLQLLGIVALWIAAKYEETYQVPKIGNLVYICDAAFDSQQILEMEANVMLVLEFGVLVNTALHFFQMINRVNGIEAGEGGIGLGSQAFEGKDYYLCRYLLELTMFEVGFLKYDRKIIAGAVVYFVRKLRKNAVCWSTKEQELFGIHENELKQCAREICLFWQRSQGIQTLTSLKVKFQAPGFKEVSKIRIGQAIKMPEPRVHLRA